MTPLAIDTETDATEAQRLVCLSYALGDKVGLLDRHQAVTFAKAALTNPDVEIVGHNLPFDFATLVQDGLDIDTVFAAYSAGRVFDTMLACQVDDIARGCFEGNRKGYYTLDGCAQRYCSIYLEKDDEIRLTFGPYRDNFVAMPERHRAYAMADATAPLALRQAVQEQPDARRQMAHAWWLYLMSLTGMPTDEKAVKALADKNIAEAAVYLKQLMAKGWIRIDKEGGLHRKVGDVQQYAWSIGVRSPTDAAIKREKTKARAEGRKYRTSDVKAANPKEVSLSWDVCEESKDSNLLAYSKFLGCFDVINKDLEYLRQPIVHPRFGLAETGRTTCWNPNLQNLKVEGGIRECFRAPDGWVFGFADFSGLELSTWAQVCHTLLGQSRLREILNDGADPHCTIAAELLGISYADAVKRKKDPNDRELYLARQGGKAFNFGCPGGGGVDTLREYAKQYELSLTWEEAERGRNLWYATYPESRPYFNLISRQEHEGQPLVQLFSGRLRGGTNFTSRANSYFQGLGGDAAKAAGWAVSEACYVNRESVLYGSRPCCFVHDELVILLPEHAAQEGILELDRLMVKAAKVFIPDVAVKTEYALSRVWSKRAKWEKGQEPWDMAA